MTNGLSRVPALRWWRIVFVAFLTYSISFMDRINVGFGFAGMEKSFGFDATIAGLTGSILFVGYFLTNMPGGQLAQKWSVKKFVLIALLVWGILAIATGLVQNLTQLLTVRFLLGIAEGGVYPAMMVLIRNWFPVNERGRALSYFILCIPFGQMFISPISGLILAHSTWRMLFVIEGLFPVVWAIVWWSFISDSPLKAKWLSSAEREYIEKGFAEEEKVVVKQAGSFGQALKNKNVWIMVLVYFFLQIGQYGIGLWLPTIVKAVAGGNSVQVGFLTALPPLAGIFGLIINGRHSDKTGERNFHVAVPVAVGAVLLMGSTLLGKEHAVMSIIAMILAVGFFQSYNGVVWAIPSEIVDASILGLVAGLINGIGTLGGGFVGPLFVGYLISKTHSVLAGEAFLAIALFLAAVFVAIVKIRKAPTPSTTTASVSH